MRKSLSDLVPKKFPQQGNKDFSAPDASWFKGESIDFLMDNLGPSNAKVYDYLDYSYTQKLIKDHTSGKKNRRLLMWSFYLWKLT